MFGPPSRYCFCMNAALPATVRIGGDRTTGRRGQNRVPKPVPNSANLRCSERISEPGIWLSRANISAGGYTRTEGVRGSSPRVGAGKPRKTGLSSRLTRWNA
jgi:hypothetical protein